MEQEKKPPPPPSKIPAAVPAAAPKGKQPAPAQKQREGDLVKRLKDCSKVPANYLRQSIAQLSPATQDELLRVLQAPVDKESDESESVKDDGKSGKAKSKTSEAEFLKWYYMVKANMLENLQSVEGGTLDLPLMVNPDLTADEVIKGAKKEQQFEAFCQYVQFGLRSIQGAQNLTFSNFIIAARRIEEAIRIFNQNPDAPEFASRGIRTDNDFFKFLGLNYTPDYIRKIRIVGCVHLHYPNIILITGCSIDDFVRKANRFMDYLDGDEDADLWRMSSSKKMEWQRTINYGLEGGGHMPVSWAAHKQTVEQWNQGRREAAARLREEEEALEAAQEEQTKKTAAAKRDIKAIKSEGGLANNNNSTQPAPPKKPRK